ncbi:MAG: tetratricopeptide repeat protein [Bacteroidota bacterium]
MRYLFLAVFFSWTTVLLFSQSTKERAKELMANTKYSDALSLLSRNNQWEAQDEDILLLKAVCQYQLNQLDEAERILNRLVEAEESPYPECWLYLGRIFHHRNQFAEAAAFYKNFLRSISQSNPQRGVVVNAIKRCANGLAIQYQKGLAFVENLGREVNTEQEEFNPILSPNSPDRLYFSSIRTGNMGGPRDRYGRPDEQLGQYRSDMYSCSNQGGIWGSTKSMHFLLNSPQREVLLGFNRDGSVLYYFKGPTAQEGRILMDTFQRVEERTLRSDPFPGPFQVRSGDQAAFIFNDTLLLFASSRPGGYGGLDLYESRYANGSWSKPKNLGPTINSPFDETAPFLSRNGKTIYFSSNHPERSIGGLDVFKNSFVASKQRWTKPYNVGIPINSAGDDVDFRLAKDGFTAYFTSTRKDGFGGRDIYAAYFEDFLPEQEVPISYTPAPVVPVDDYPALPPPIAKPPATSFTPPPVVASSMTNISYTSANSLDEERLQSIKRQLIDYPESQLIISAYAKNEAIPDRLFEGITSAEKVADWFTQNGISPDRLFLRAPWQLPEGIKGIGAEVELSFYTSTEEPDLPHLGVEQSLFAPKATLNAGLCYKVQFVSVKKKYTHPAITMANEPMVELSPKVGYYRYTLGAFEDYASAKQFQQQVRRMGFKSAFVVPYTYGMRADNKMARAATTQFPDLANYLNRK